MSLGDQIVLRIFSLELFTRIDALVSALVQKSGEMVSRKYNSGCI